jgi:hypothetical protein
MSGVSPRRALTPAEAMGLYPFRLYGAIFSFWSLCFQLASASGQGAYMPAMPQPLIGELANRAWDVPPMKRRGVVTVRRTVRPFPKGVCPSREGLHPSAEGVRPSPQVLHPLPHGVRPLPQGVHPLALGLRPFSQGANPMTLQISQLRRRELFGPS